MDFFLILTVVFGVVTCVGAIIAIITLKYSWPYNIPLLKDHGSTGAGFGHIDPKKIKQMCEESDEIKLMYVSGRKFFINHGKELEEASARGCIIKILLATPYSKFVDEIERIEKRKSHNSINNEIKEIIGVIDGINERNISKVNSKKIELRHFSTLYRISTTLYRIKEISYVWFNIFAPPNVATNSVLISAKCEDKSNNENLVAELEKHFDKVWNEFSMELSHKDILELEKDCGEEALTPS